MVNSRSTKKGYIKIRKGITSGVYFERQSEIMQGTKAVNADLYHETSLKGGAMISLPQNIKLWIDPNNGKYLGKYDDYE